MSADEVLLGLFTCWQEYFASAQTASVFVQVLCKWHKVLGFTIRGRFSSSLLERHSKSALDHGHINGHFANAFCLACGANVNFAHQCRKPYLML